MRQRTGWVYFIGAGPGDPELLTLKGKRVLESADVIVYADSLVNSAICAFAREGAEIHGSASLSLREVSLIMVTAAREGKIVVRLHSGDSSVFGATLEQMAVLESEGIGYEVIPGVSSIFAAAAALKAELTIPDVSQTVIISRLEGRTPVPEKQRLSALAAHDATLVLYLSVGMIDQVVAELLAGGCSLDTAVAVVHRASWEDEKVIIGTLADIADKVRRAAVDKQALILVGKALDPELRCANGHKSKLYDEGFSHGRRKAKQ